MMFRILARYETLTAATVEILTEVNVENTVRLEVLTAVNVEITVRFIDSHNRNC